MPERAHGLERPDGRSQVCAVAPTVHRRRTCRTLQGRCCELSRSLLINLVLVSRLKSPEVCFVGR